jgi:hypothetical protein
MAHYSKHMIAHAEMDGPYRHEFEPPQADARLIDAIRLEPGPIWGIGESFNVIVDLRRPAAPVRVHIRLARSTGEVLFQDVSPPCTVPGPVRYVVHQSPLCPVEGFVSVAITDEGTGALLDQRLDAHRFEVTAPIPFDNFATRCDEPWEVEFSPHT